MIKSIICSKFRVQTKYGIYRWNPWFVLGIAVTCNIGMSMFLGIPLFIIESNYVDSNINTYEDAVWLLWMSASTVGFGDVYPTEGFSRVIVGFMTIPGTMLIGSAINMASTVAFSWTDNNVCNSELRAMIHQQDKQLTEMRRDMERIRRYFEVPDVVEKR